jgi:hypothetical protein
VTNRQRLGKHIPAGANALENRKPIARKRINKHASLSIEAVFSQCKMIIKLGSVEQNQLLSEVERVQLKKS